jgi:FkbM family methyltransferase
LEGFGKTIEFAQQVRVTTLDKYWNSVRRIDFIKIDIEGAEEAALNGANNILSENRISMIFF